MTNRVSDHEAALKTFIDTKIKLVLEWANRLFKLAWISLDKSSLQVFIIALPGHHFAFAFLHYIVTAVVLPVWTTLKSIHYITAHVHFSSLVHNLFLRCRKFHISTNFLHLRTWLLHLVFPHIFVLFAVEFFADIRCWYSLSGRSSGTYMTPPYILYRLLNLVWVN